MTGIARFLKATLVGGIVFLLPIGIVIVVFGKLLSISAQASRAMHDMLFPGYESYVASTAMAIVILLLIALGAGLFARTRLGQSIFVWLENAVLSRLPIYAIFRQMVIDMSGGAERLAGQKDLRVVKVRFDDQTQWGFVIEEGAPEGIVVYLPGAPSALSGTVVVVDAERITDSALSPNAVFAAMRRLGAGLLERR